MGAAKGRYQCRWHSFPAILRSLSGAPRSLGSPAGQQQDTEQARLGVGGRGAGAEVWAGEAGCLRALSLHSSLVHRDHCFQHQHVLQCDPDWAGALGLPSAGRQGLQHAAHYLPGKCVGMFRGGCVCPSIYPSPRLLKNRAYPILSRGAGSGPNWMLSSIDPWSQPQLFTHLNWPACSESETS